MQGMTLTPALYEQMKRQLDGALAQSTDLYQNPIGQQIWGMPLRSSPMFPVHTHCQKCNQTGEGTESTYCEYCNGAGAVKTVGMLLDRGVTTLIREPLPKLFKPSFPHGLVPMPPLCRGLP